ncbi:DUF397 domain-containing protein [Streptomyces albidus (ex Kaewkla and Franco 2022)]|uniref:DUF397 domain-containing protein n=1 Tax=Streptomyces albidus (ex Kaewkla and Franco 2022) TaxID=722709 RepID=UPI0015EEF24A|nr:DUF397 domain-containing protein [Streptomyces albidus (ex Kaewkla and Franco 2022)]
MLTRVDLDGATWRKSSHSNGSGGNCVEVGGVVTGVVPVRDSKRADGSVLVFPARGWEAFLGAVKQRHF